GKGERREEAHGRNRGHGVAHPRHSPGARDQVGRRLGMRLLGARAARPQASRSAAVAPAGEPPAVPAVRASTRHRWTLIGAALTLPLALAGGVWAAHSHAAEVPRDY